MLTAALPYVIVRYVVGSLDLLDALTALALLLLIAMLLTAVALVISVQSANRPLFSVFRIILILFIGVPLANQIIIVTFMGFSRAFRLFSPVMGTGLAVIVFVYAMFILLLLLEYAASCIATQSENHAYVKRILGLLALVSGWIFHAAGLGSPWLINTSIGLYLLLICRACREIPLRAEAPPQGSPSTLLHSSGSAFV